MRYFCNIQKNINFVLSLTLKSTRFSSYRNLDQVENPHVLKFYVYIDIEIESKKKQKIDFMLYSNRQSILYANN